MDTTQEIKMALPKKTQGHWLSFDGKIEKQKLQAEFDQMSYEDKLKYNEEIIGKIEVADKKSEVAEDTITMSVSQLESLLDKKLEEKLKSLQDSKPKAEKLQDSPAVTQIKNELFDDLPELRNFKLKERIYVLCDGTKPLSFGIPTRHKDSSPLQYINKETNETFALFYSLTQSSFFKEKHKGDSKVEHITMKDGMLKTYETDIKLQKFLAINPHNKANGGSIFEEYNPSAEAEITIDSFELETKARNLAIDLPYIKQDAIARLLCADYKETWTVAEVKKALFLEVAKAPTQFIKLANDQTLEMKGIAKTAVHRGILIYKNYKWSNEKGDVLCEVARNQDEFDAIAEFFMTGEGRTTYDFVRNSIG